MPLDIPACDAAQNQLVCCFMEQFGNENVTLKDSGSLLVSDRRNLNEVLLFIVVYLQVSWKIFFDFVIHYLLNLFWVGR